MELKNLVLELSELLDAAIRKHAEFSPKEWERLGEAQRKAYALKHPEIGALK